MDLRHPTCVLDAPRRQAGAILVVSLLLLVIMTVLALGANRFTRMQTGGAAELREQMLAFQAAEAALSAGERIVSDPARATRGTPCSTGHCLVYPQNAFDVPTPRRTADWWRKHGWLHEGEHSSRATRAESWYVIEELEDMSAGSTVDSRYYRVTAASVRGNDVDVVLQSVFATPLLEAQHAAMGRQLSALSGRQSWRQVR